MSTESSLPVSTDPAIVSGTALSANGDETNPGNMHPGANYFFGFLITFIVLLFIFIGCGLGSRRRMARRRAMFLGDVAGPWAGLRTDINQKEPMFWEPRLEKGGDVWSSIMPLSMTILRPTSVESTASLTTNATPHGLSTFPFSSWIPTFGSASNNKTNAVPELAHEPIKLQLAVMIALPSRNRSSEDSIVGPSECQFGVIHVPWEGGQPSPPSVP